MADPFKLVPQLDEEGFYVGLAYAFENPVRPGTFLIPGGAIDVPAPDIPAGQRAFWSGDAWEFSAIPDPIDGPASEPSDN